MVAFRHYAELTPAAVSRSLSPSQPDFDFNNTSTQMLLSQQDIQSADLSFYPALVKKSSKRQVFLSTKTGVILTGITISKKKGEQYFSVDVPSVLKITNRPEHGKAEVETLPKLGEIEQPLSDLTREVLRTRLRESLS